jgi:TDG/mug DNA glycosylase family protein
MLKDLLASGLRVVFCGSAVGRVSFERRAYYAGSGNRFWQILAATQLTPRQLDPTEYRSLLAYGIGLTDVVKNQAGSDDQIKFLPGGRAELEAKIHEYTPNVLCFNGKRAAMEFLAESRVQYGLQSKHVGPTALFVAPSTSGAARRWWDPSIWHDLARLVPA